MRKVLVVLAMVAGCGGDGGGSPEAPDAAEPAGFAGVFDTIEDFPTDGCVAGSLAGFALVDLWPSLGMRTALPGGALAVYLAAYPDDVRVPHVLSNDGLLVRTVSHTNVPSLRSLRICAVGPDGTLIGHEAHCDLLEGRPDPLQCFVDRIEAHPFRRAPGEGESAHLTLLGELDGLPRWPAFTANVRVDGAFAYLARGDDGLRIVDVSDPGHPRERGHFVVAGEDYYNDVKVLRDGLRRYVVAASSPVRVIDVTNPDAPILVANISSSAHTLFIEGTTAYLATGGGGEVAAYDLSHPLAPRYLGGYDGARGVHDLYVEGGVAYLSATFEGMIVVDFTDPAHPVEVGREDVSGEELRLWHSPWVTRIGGRRVIAHGDEGSETGLRLLDGEPTSPTFLHALGEWKSRPEVSIHNVMAFGERAYVAHYRDGVRIFDLHDPAAPAVIGYYNTWILGTPSASRWSGAFGVDVDLGRRRLFVADAQRGLMILAGDTTVFP